MPEAIAAVRGAFLALSRQEFVAPLRTSFDAGRTLVMPVFHAPTGTTSTKTVVLRPGERPAVRGVVTWLSDELNLVLDASAVTTLRTGAVVGVATDLLAAEDACHLVVIGAGTQAFDQVRAVLAVRPVERVSIVSRTLSSAEALRDRVASVFPSLSVVAGRDPAVHVAAADIVCCATSSLEPVFDVADLPEQVHVNAVGAYTLAMKELPPGVFAGSDVVVDELEAARKEAGDLMGAVEDGVLDLSAVTELGSRLERPDARAESHRTVFKSVGLGIQDWAICRVVASRVSERTTAPAR